VVRREITQILTPGSILDAGQLEPKQNNSIASVAPVQAGFGVAALDLTTGEFFAGDFPTAEALRDAIGRSAPPKSWWPGPEDRSGNLSALQRSAARLSSRRARCLEFCPGVSGTYLARHFKDGVA